jgi:putative oxidoreductase
MNHENAVVTDRTVVDVSLLLVRAIVGIIFAAHGAQKAFGWFGGPGLAAIAEMMGPVGYLVAIGECFGGLAMVLGIFSRFSAAANIIIMIGAIVLVHGQHGFFLGKDPSKAGFEYNLALIGLLLPIFLAGPGKLSLAWAMLPRSKKTNRPMMILE